MVYPLNVVGSLFESPPVIKADMFRITKTIYIIQQNIRAGFSWKKYSLT
jgi:hypothetical protein